MNIAGRHALFDEIENKSPSTKNTGIKNTETSSTQVKGTQAKGIQVKGTQAKDTQSKSTGIEHLAGKNVIMHQETSVSTSNSEIDPDVPALIALFNSTFEDFNTRLVLGDDEPIYIPAGITTSYHQIVFAHGFFSSALHEIAHWCIAGEKRRLLEDYGYWYCPDGRDAAQQADFEKVEIKPQAIEWAFTEAAGRKFQVSTDNLNGAEPDREGFTQNVATQLQRYKSEGFPPRAERFITALSSVFGNDKLSDTPINVVNSASTDSRQNAASSGLGDGIGVNAE
ncbi:elongation factor P hydroxylase [Alteromonas portus]|uniref:Elongation factor P hydroxylase n=2 Tax=Alteromonas portus TaxID=2565549 RepID=A0A4V5NQ93_9ALTE|nr:elongation factor P hydroxylase [Alteromonas portus]